MTVLYGVIEVDGKRGQSCPSNFTAVLQLVHSPTFDFGVGIYANM